MNHSDHVNLQPRTPTSLFRAAWRHAWVCAAALMPMSAAAVPADFTNITWTAAYSTTYDHDVGGGAFNSGVFGVDIDDALEGASFACGDTVSLLLRIPVRAGACGTQSLDVSLQLTADTTGQGGAAFSAITQVQVNYGVTSGTGDSGMVDDGGSTATLLNQLLTPSGAVFSPGEELTATIRVDDLEAGEAVVVRVDARLACQPNSSPTGNLAALAQGIQTSFSSCGEATGGQVLAGPIVRQLRTVADVAGARKPLPKLSKTVTSEGGTCPGSEQRAITGGDVVKYCFRLMNEGTRPLLNAQVLDDASTPENASDDFGVTLIGLADLDADTASDDLAPGAQALGEALITFGVNAAGMFTNTALARGNGDLATVHNDTDTASVSSVCRDSDMDGLCEGDDNCPLHANVDQTDVDMDEAGDPCDPDDDNDTVPDTVDNCVLQANTNQANNDADAPGDLCDPDDDNDTVMDEGDNCPLNANTNQMNTDNDARGDLCDTCPLDAANDADGDGVCADVDTCSLIPNLDQTDSDDDGFGDACDACDFDPTRHLVEDGPCEVDECQTDNGGCDPRVTCSNTPGSRTCGPCPMGFTGDGVTCISTSSAASSNGTSHAASTSHASSAITANPTSASTTVHSVDGGDGDEVPASGCDCSSSGPDTGLFALLAMLAMLAARAGRPT